MIVVDGVEYLTAAEAAELLGIKVATLYAYASRGRIQSYRRGVKRQRFYRRPDVDALLAMKPADQHTTPSAAEVPPAESWIPYV